MKRFAAVFLAFIGVGAALSAQDRLFSVGGGLIGVNNWMVFTNTFDKERSDDTLAGDSKMSKSTNIGNALDFGGYAFFDATYGEFDLIISGGKAFYGSGGGGDGALDAVKLGLALYGKYPIKIGSSGLSIAPMAGIQYDIVLGAFTAGGNPVQPGNKTKGTGIFVYGGKDDPAKEGTLMDLNTLSLKLGADARYFFTEQLFLDSQILWGVVFDSTSVAGLRQSLKDADAKTDIFTHGVTFKLGLGYRF